MTSDMETLRKQSSQNTQDLGNVHDQSNTNISTSELPYIYERIDALELISQTYGTTLSRLEAQNENLNDWVENYTNETAAMESTMLAESRSLKSRMTAIEDSNEMLNVLTNQLSNGSQVGYAKLLLIEAEMDTLVAAMEELELNKTVYIPQIESRIIQIELDSETNHTAIKNNSDRINNLEAYMAQGNELLKTLSVSLTDQAIDIRAINISTQNARNDVIQNRELIRILNETLTAESYIGKYVYSNLTFLEMKIATVDTAVQNNHEEMIKYNDRLGLLNESMTYYVLNLESAQSFGANVTDLEQKMETLESSIYDNFDKISSTILDVKDMNKSTLESISLLDSRLTNIAGNRFIHLTLSNIIYFYMVTWFTNLRNL